MTKRYPGRSRFNPVRISPALTLFLAFAIFPAGILLLAGAPSPAAARSTAQTVPVFTFEKQEVVIGPAARQTVLSGFLLGRDVADLAVVHVDERGDPYLRVYAYEDGTWALNTNARLRPGVSFVDLARIGSRDRLITYGEGRLDAWDPESSTEVVLAAATSSFDPPHPGEVPHVDVTHDVNGDGRIDLVLPDDDGFRVFVQLNDGSFADPVVVGPPAVLERIYGADGYRFDPWSVSRVHAFDYNGDARVDLVFWNGDHFEAHIQDDRGLFDPEAVTFTTAVRFDSDDLSTLAAGDMKGRVLYSFTDLNGDGVADLVVYALEGDSIADKRSVYEVYYGSRASDGSTRFAPEGRASDGRASDGRTSDGGIHFAPKADISIRSEGNIQLAMDQRDFDGDGEIDLVVTTIENKYLESSLFKRIKGFMGDDVWLNLAFYRVSEGRIPDRPTAIRKIQLDGAPSPREPGWVPLDFVLQGGKHARRTDREQYRRAFNKNLFIGDVTGNGRSDLLIEWTHREMHVYAGVPGPDLFAGQPQKVAVELPNDEEYAWMADLNGDGRQDIVLHRPFKQRDAHGAPTQQPGVEPHRVTLLIASTIDGSGAEFGTP
ncbi:MAG: VCBS repeat-containing protein [Gemmatimonadetes bacterium]|nr:VCBS repeat-containing protein [Gemmatimonadota bacterium]